MTIGIKRTITTSLPESELDELDRVRERQNLSRSEALREAVRWYVGAMRHLPAPDEPQPDELAALREAEEEFARGGGRPLRDVLRDLDRRPK
jgi:metal-responsive CopG/Arc/MetJ family transcriptional regulator